MRYLIGDLIIYDFINSSTHRRLNSFISVQFLCSMHGVNDEERLQRVQLSTLALYTFR